MELLSVEPDGLEWEFDFVLWFLNLPFKLQTGPGKSAIALAIFNHDWNLKLSFKQAMGYSSTQLWYVCKGYLSEPALGSARP